MLLEVGRRRQAVVADIVPCADRNEMQLPELPELDVRRYARAEADHHVGVIFAQVDQVQRRLEMQLNLREFAREIRQRRRSEQCGQSIGDADPHSPDRLTSFFFEIAGD